MHQEPLISICIPAYNNSKTIAFCIESVLNQKYTTWEAIILDDCSGDSTFNIAESFKDPRIKVLRNDYNLGIGVNWNQVISLAKGNYIKLLCADDILYEDCLLKQAEILENPKFDHVVLVVSYSHIIDSDNSVLFRRKYPFGSGLLNGKSVIKNCVRSGTNLLGEPSIGLFRKDALSKTAMYNPANSYLLDLDFWAKLLKSGDVYIINDYLAAFRISTQSVTTKIGFKQAGFFRMFIKELSLDPYYNINKFDIFYGSVLSFILGLLRNLFIRLHR